MLLLTRPVLRPNVPAPLRLPSRWRWRSLGSAVRASTSGVGGGEVDVARASSSSASEGAEGGARLADKLRAWKDNRVHKQTLRSEHFDQVKP
jgi:hypothetical protein